MKRWAVLMLVVLATPVGAWTTVLEDPAGDVAVRLGEQADQTDPTDRSSPTDLLSLEIEEDLQAFRFRVTNAGWTTGPQATVVDEGSYWILWTYADTGYGILFRRLQADSGPQLDAILARVDDDVPTRLQELQFEMGDGTVSIEVPRLSIIDSRGASPRPGEALGDVEVLSFGTATLYLSNSDDVRGSDDEAVIRSWDAMGPPTAWAVQEGVKQEGDLELWSPDPMRISNGAAGAFVFDARLRSHGGAHVASLAVENVPDGWDVTLPVSAAQVPAGGEARLPVVVSIPFAHAHGSRDVLLLTARDGDHVGRIELGIIFTDTPQPAGHHDTLFIHTDHGPAISLAAGFGAAQGGDARARAFMNTLEDDPTDEGRRVPSDGAIVAGGQVTVMWQVPLRPGLAMGLDLTDETGHIEVPIEYDYIATGLRLGGHLSVAGQTIAELEPGASADVTRGQVVLSAAIHPRADVVPYEQGNDLVLHVNVTGTFQGPYPGPDTAAHLVSGGWLQLPLEEYQDAPEALSSAGLSVQAPVSRRDANPGDAVLFRLEVTSTTPRALTISMAGQNAHWAQAHPARVQVDDQDEVLIAVGVPGDAAIGDVADLVVSIADEDDPSIRTIGRLTVAVTDEPMDSDAEAERLLRGGTSANAPVPVWLVAAAVVGAMLRRRASPP